MQTGDGRALWGEAFSPDGQILAVAYTDRIFLWDVASTAGPGCAHPGHLGAAGLQRGVPQPL